VDTEFGGESTDVGGGDDGEDSDGDDVETAPRGRGRRRRPSTGPSMGLFSNTGATSSGAMCPSMFQTVLDHLNQLHVQN